MSDEITHVSVKDLRPGRFMLIDGIPCRVVQIEMSAPGKHGSAKARITAIGIFDGQKKTYLAPSHAEVEAPVITKTKAQVVSVTDTTAQLMNLETYDTYELPIPEDLRGSVKPGTEVEVMESMGRTAILRVM